MVLSRLAFIVFFSVLGAGVVLAQDATYTVKPGDILKVSVWKEPDLQGPILIRPDGGFSFPLVGEVDGRGKTVAELQVIMTQRLSKYISDPVVSVSVTEIHGNKVYVIGQVVKPGEFIVNPSVDVMQALSMAGGMTAFASLANIIILRHNGTTRTALHFDYTDVAKGKKFTDDIQLQSGDVVVVP
ncbi:MAG: polysaccharide biosynthesis/export family protein [Steroidobacteraceae bacterium]|jgi:polysaccharide export outer membrane protein